jgi:hypothetical protein
VAIYLQQRTSSLDTARAGELMQQLKCINNFTDMTRLLLSQNHMVSLELIQ